MNKINIRKKIICRIDRVTLSSKKIQCQYWNFKLFNNLEFILKSKVLLKFVTVVIIFSFEILAVNLASKQSAS
jgi:hypothetical protein